MKPRNPPLQSFRLLDHVKEQISYFNLQIEKCVCIERVFHKILGQVLHERIPLFF